MADDATTLPDPLVPAEVDLRQYPFTPIFRARLFGSSFHARSTDAEWRAGVTLWLKSWDQVPAGTLPDDDIDLCRLAELGRDHKAWLKVKEAALRGWFKCKDGRLHHEVVAEGVIEAWHGRLVGTKRGKAGAAAKWGNAAENKLKRHERLAAARAKGTHTAEEWEALVRFCNSSCVRCQAVVDAPVKDHIVPIYQGGSDAIDNLQPMCKPCNSAKGPDNTDFRPFGWLEAVHNAPASAGINEQQTPTKTPAKADLRRLQTPGNREGEEREKEENPPLAPPSTSSAEAPPPLPLAGGSAAVDSAQRMVDAWNEILGGFLPRVQAITDVRRKKLKLRAKDHFRTFAEWRAFCERVKRCPHLIGATAPRKQGEVPWRATLDWVLEPANMVKILEGNYDPRSGDANGEPDSPYVRALIAWRNGGEKGPRPRREDFEEPGR